MEEPTLKNSKTKRKAIKINQKTIIATIIMTIIFLLPIIYMGYVILTYIG